MASASTIQTEVGPADEIDSTGKGVEDGLNVGQLQELLKELVNVFNDSKMQGWDGDDADPVSDAAFLNATKLLSSMPIGLPVPNVLADNDGYIEFEWAKDRKNFSLYATDTNLVLYAGFYDKDDHLSGRFVFEGAIPDRVAVLAGDVYK